MSAKHGVQHAQEHLQVLTLEIQPGLRDYKLKLLETVQALLESVWFFLLAEHKMPTCRGFNPRKSHKLSVIQRRFRISNSQQHRHCEYEN